MTVDKVEAFLATPMALASVPCWGASKSRAGYLIVNHGCLVSQQSHRISPPQTKQKKINLSQIK